MHAGGERRKVWVLTDLYNDYDQHGAYFVAVFLDKPTRERLLAAIPEDARWHPEGVSLIDHILAGGGRQKHEDHWYELKEVETF
jgi:hypothetical protein